MIWAAINGGIFVSYEAIWFTSPSGTAALLEYGLAWAPWVVLGALATTVVWRSPALESPLNAEGSRWVTPAATATFLFLVLGGLAILALARIPVNGASWAMFAVGAAAAVVGGSGLTTLARSEQVFWLTGGVGLAVITAGIVFVAPQFGYDPAGLFLVLGPVSSTALLFGGGLYTASRKPTVDPGKEPGSD